MRTVRCVVAAAVVIASVLALLLMVWATMRGRPQDLPWTPLDLADPVGLFTGRKLTALGGEPGRCRALLDQGGIAFTALPARRAGASCGYDDAVRFRPGGAVTTALRPGTVGMSCPVAAGLAVWEWNVVQPAAMRYLGSRVTAVEHFGSYSCRRMYGRAGGSWSEHARANAIDIAGFRLADGRRLTIARDWRGDGADARFLRAVRDGACDLFATTLSPDYNAAHHDHLHLDQARRGSAGWRACR